MFLQNFIFKGNKMKKGDTGTGCGGTLEGSSIGRPDPGLCCCSFSISNPSPSGCPSRTFLGLAFPARKQLATCSLWIRSQGLGLWDWEGRKSRAKLKQGIRYRAGLLFGQPGFLLLRPFGESHTRSFRKWLTWGMGTWVPCWPIPAFSSQGVPLGAWTRLPFPALCLCEQRWPCKGLMLNP